MVETRSGINIEPETHLGPEAKTVKGETTGAATIKVRAGGHRGTAPGGARGRFFGLSTSQMYTLLALGYAALAVPLTFSCHAAAKFAFGKAADPTDDQHCHLFQLYAAGLSTGAGMALALEELARGNLLHTYTADILKLGLIGHAIASFAMMTFFPRTVSAGWVALEGLAALATGMLPATTLLTSLTDRSRIWRDFQNMPNWAIGALRFRAPSRRFSWLAIAYNLLTLTFPVAGLSYFLAPRWTLCHTFGYDYGASTHYLWSAIGTAALMTFLPAATMALKHKADIQRMSATPARTLNLGLMGTSIGHLLVLGKFLYQPILLALAFI